jgi:type I restriction enzyme S subunit
MTDLPPGWAWARLDEVAEVRLGRQRSPKNHTGSQMRPYLRAANVGWQGLRLDDVKLMNFTDDEAQTYRLEHGDIVVSEASGSPGEVGKPALWRGEIEGCCLQNTLIRVRSLGAVEPTYLLRFLWNEAFCGAFADRSRGVGIHHLGSARLAEWLIPVPPLPEQRRIVANLERYLTHIEVATANLRSVQHKIDSLVSSHRHAVTTYFASGMQSLGDVLVDIEAGKSFAVKSRPAGADEWGIIKVSAMTWGEFKQDENKAVPQDHEIDVRYEIKSGDLLISRANTEKYVGASVLVHE